MRDGIPQNIVLNFWLEFLKKDLTINLASKVFRIFLLNGKHAILKVDEIALLERHKTNELISGVISLFASDLTMGLITDYCFKEVIYKL